MKEEFSFSNRPNRTENTPDNLQLTQLGLAKCKKNLLHVIINDRS